MREFFIDEYKQNNFDLFCPLHILLTIITLLGLYYIIKNKDKLYNLSNKTKLTIKITGLIIMFLNMKIYYLSKIVYGVYDITVHLPLHLCFISGYFFMIVHTFNIEKLKPITIYFSFIGPLPAIIFPELYSTFDSFVFYQFIISHHFFMLFSLFLFYSYDIKLKSNSHITCIKIMSLILILITIVNTILNSNYIFTSYYPIHIINLFPFIVNIPPLIVMILVGLSVILLIHYILNYKNQKK